MVRQPITAKLIDAIKEKLRPKKMAFSLESSDIVERIQDALNRCQYREDNGRIFTRTWSSLQAKENRMKKKPIHQPMTAKLSDAVKIQPIKKEELIKREAYLDLIRNIYRKGSHRKLPS